MDQSLPKVQLNRWQSARLFAVGIVVAFMVMRVVPDTIRVVVPIGQFGYATNDDGIVTKVGPQAKGTDPLLVGDRVRVDRIAPFDRKPGIVRIGFTRANFDRRLPIERNGVERVVHLKAVNESMAGRFIVFLRIILYVVAVSIGALLLIVMPRLATFAFFVFCLGGAEPTTFTDVLFDPPWREIAPWLGDFIAGQAPFALLLFAACLAVDDRRARTVIGAVLGVVAVSFGIVHGYDAWRIIYLGLPAQRFNDIYAAGETAANVVTALMFVVAFVRLKGAERQRTGWIIAAFAIAGAGRFISEHFFPAYLNFWENGALLSLSIVPVAAVWVAVVKDHFFDIDFVVSRALVYVTISGAVIFIVGGSEELLTYLFYNNTDLAYGIIIACSLVIGSTFGKVRDFLEHFVDRFIFRGRHAQRTSLERVALNLLDADDAATVYSMLLHDVPSILDLSFSGIMMRTAEGGFVLAHDWNWPADCVNALAPGHALTIDINKTRGMFDEDAVRSTMIRSLFPHDCLTYAAPLYVDRQVAALVMYGQCVSGLDVDPEERVTLMRVMANASLALNSIEIAGYRAALDNVVSSASVADALVPLQSEAPAGVRND